MEIILPKIQEYEDTDIILCNMLCFDAKGLLMHTIIEKVLYCRYRGFNSHYLKHIPNNIEKKVKLIKIQPVKVIGTEAVRN